MAAFKLSQTAIMMNQGKNYLIDDRTYNCICVK